MKKLLITACLLGISQASMALDVVGIFPKNKMEDFIKTARVKSIFISGDQNKMIITDYDGTKTTIRLTDIIETRTIYFIDNPGKGVK